MSVLRFEKNVQPSTSSLSYGEKVNENKTISVRNTLTLNFDGIAETKLKKLEVAI